MGLFCGRQFLSYAPHRHFRRAYLFLRSTFIHALLISETSNKPSIMPFDTINMEEITKARRKAIAESIRTINAEELKALGEKLFPGVDHPWREKVFGFISEKPGATFHHTTTHHPVPIIYSHPQDKG